MKVVFIENYRVSNALRSFCGSRCTGADIHASKEASGTGNMKFMLNGAPHWELWTVPTLRSLQEVGEENAFIFGISSDEINQL